MGDWKFDNYEKESFAGPIRARVALAESKNTVAVKVLSLVGLPAAHAIGQMPTAGLRERTALRLVNPHPTASPSQLYADMGLVDGLLMPPGGFRAFVRRQVLPPPEVLTEQARHAGKRRARSAVGHCAGVLARYTLSVARLARAPEAPH